MTSYICLLVLFVTTSYFIFTVNASNVFVKESDNVTCQNVPCLTLNALAEGPLEHFLNNSTLIFLPGHHELSSELYFQNISNVELTALHNNTVVVLASHSGVMMWVECDNIRISGLNFILNGDSQIYSSPALLFEESNGSLSHMTVRCTWRVKSIFLVLSHIQIRDVQASGEGNITGNVLFVLDGIVDFYGDNLFANNRALESGAAMIFQDCTVNFYDKISFVRNYVITVSLYFG